MSFYRSKTSWNLRSWTKSWWRPGNDFSNKRVRARAVNNVSTRIRVLTKRTRVSVENNSCHFIFFCKRLRDSIVTRNVQRRSPVKEHVFLFGLVFLFFPLFLLIFTCFVLIVCHISEIHAETQITVYIFGLIQPKKTPPKKRFNEHWRIFQPGLCPMHP